MGNDSGAGAVERRAPGQMEAPAGRPGFDGVVGSPIEYAAAEFLGEDGWSLTPQSARDWAATTAGAPIKDPVTGANQPYWYCNISPDERSGPAGLKAEFDLFMFGRRGLAVCRGTTESFVASPGGTRWRQTRFDLPVDPARIRNDHRRGALSNTGVNSTAPSAKSASPAGGLLPDHLLSKFGNLPTDTQRFLVEPFVLTGKRPQQSVLRAMTEVRGGFLIETMWTYLFNARWLSFAFLQRSVAITTQYESNEETWSASRETQELTRTPWNLAAWVAPVKKRPTAASLSWMHDNLESLR